mmetsp:Transcript_30297/g.59545  ORF Transcript_30297/g.59545 Transcript_30297/m.59545 type:complete len:82 (-) Transcript_30297:1588-1833(-)
MRTQLVEWAKERKSPFLQAGTQVPPSTKCLLCFTTKTTVLAADCLPSGGIGGGPAAVLPSTRDREGGGNEGRLLMAYVLID